jgi:heme/copper-type cytochrome/quinol oxidase subunit 1
MRRAKVLLSWIVPLMGVAVGGWLLARPTPPASFGWTAYHPLSTSADSPIMTSTFTIDTWGGAQWTGFALAAAGLLALAFLAGRASVRRQRRP